MRDYVANPVFTFKSFENYKEFCNLLDSKSISHQDFECVIDNEYQVEVYYRFSFEKLKQIYNCVHNLENYRKNYFKAREKAFEATSKFEESVNDRKDTDQVAALYGDMLTSGSAVNKSCQAYREAQQNVATLIFG